MGNRCFACTKTNKLTLEHIIPQAIGGRLKAKLYCKVCNETFGHVLDDEIVKQFGSIGTLLNIKRERGETQPYEVKELSTGTPLVFNGKGLKRKRPIVKIESKDGKKLDFADVTTRSDKELKEICASIQKRYEVAGEFKTFKGGHPGPTDAEYEITIDNALLRRAVSKIAYGFLCIKLLKDNILSSPFEAIREHIKAERGPALACANFIHTQFMTDHIRPLHKIHIALNRSEKLVAGYVSLFGIYRFTVLLAENYESKFEWPGLDYTFDPVRLEQVVGNDNFRAPQLTKENILRPKQSKRYVLNELHKGDKAIENYVANFKFLGGELN